MSLTTLSAIRSHLKNHAALSAWFAAHYPGRVVQHFIGYKKPVNANDYPAICYVPVRERIGEQPFGKLTVSLVVSLNEKGMTNDVFDGVTRTDEAAQLIGDALLAIGGPISVENGLITVTTDLGLTHPFYDIELQFTALATQAAVDESTLNDFNTFHADYDIDPFQTTAEHNKWLQEPADHTTGAPELSDTVNLP